MNRFFIKIAASISFVIWCSGTLSAQTLTVPGSFSNGTANLAYPPQTLQVSGGTAPYTWTVASGSLPLGLSLSTGGVITGTPTFAGVFTFTIRVTDSLGAKDEKPFPSITISPVITTSSLPGGAVGIAYTPQTLAATIGPAATATWKIDSASLNGTAMTVSSSGSSYSVNGLNLAITDGVLSGTPAAAGTLSLTIKADVGLIASKTFLITIQPALSVSNSSGTTITLPQGVVNAFYAYPLMAIGPAPVTWSVVSGILPPGMTLTSTGSVVGTPSASGAAFSFTVQVTGGSPVQTATQSYTMAVIAGLSITTSVLPSLNQGTAFSTSFSATGGRPPYTWTVQTALPAAIGLSASGTLSGTPTNPGTTTVVVQVADTSDGFIPVQTATRTFTLTVSTALTITTTSLPTGAVGTSYSQSLSATAGIPPLTWSIQQGALPEGLTFSNGGVISGTPTVPGAFSVPVTVVDGSVPAQTATKTLSLTVVSSSLSITTSSTLPVGAVGVFYLQDLAASGPSPQNWSVVSGVAPPGMSVTPTGALGGIPTVAGTFNFTVRATGGSDPVQTATKAFRIVINPALTITTVSLPDATLSTPYSVTLTVNGGLPDYLWTNPGRGLPAGFSLSSSGVISGMPMSPGSFSFSVQVSDSYNPTQQVTKTFTVSVLTVATISTSSLPDPIQSVAYKQQLLAAGAAPFTWVISGGSLPAGLSLTADGILQGIPATTGSQAFTVTVLDARGASSFRTFNITVDPPLPLLSLSSVPQTLNPTGLSRVALSLSAPYANTISGQLVLSFVSKADVPVDDQATQFSTGSRTVSFTIPANSTDAVFAAPVMLLMGTVAGTVNLTANFDNGPAAVPVASVEIVPLAPQMTSVTAVHTLAGVEVQITGYAPSRRITTAEFSFDVKDGSKTKPVTVTKNVDTDFASWYRSPTSTPFGASFSFVQSFTITGDVSLIQDVMVRLSNAQGSTVSKAVRLQ